MRGFVSLSGFCFMVFTSILSFNHYTLERVEWIVSGGIIKIIVTNKKPEDIPSVSLQISSGYD
ncbi:hypothetical protein K250101E9_21330 [Enterocloster aldenensis]